MAGHKDVVLLGILAVFALLGAACTDDDETAPTSSSTSSLDPSLFDEHARSECPDEVESGRILGGQLMAAYDTTAGDATRALTDELAYRYMSYRQRDDPAVVCWYEDVVDDPEDEIAPPASSTVAVIYISGRSLGVLPQDGPPVRP